MQDRDWQTMVEEFHEQFGFPVDFKPHELKWTLTAQRMTLILEEVAELSRALYEDKRELIADALGDLIYVTIGTAVAYGLKLDPIVREIHRSNMTKDAGEFKPVKGASFKLPRLEDLI